MFTKKFNFNSVFIVFLIGFAIWMIPTPQGFDQKAWILVAIFMATIYGIIAAPVPMGAISLMSVAACIVTQIMTAEQALGGYADPILWLVMFSFFISKGFSNTNLGRRVAYVLISKIGKNVLGLSYGFTFTDLILAPFMPSATARGGGTLYPIVNALVAEFKAESAIRRDYGFNTSKFLMMVCYQSVVITSCMFLTSMAGNSLSAKIAIQNGIDVTWFSWALGSIVPGLITLLVMPLVLYWLCAPDIKNMEGMQVAVRHKLEELGPLAKDEKIMIGTFMLLLTSWIFGEHLPHFGIPMKIDAATTALLGCIVLLLTRVLKWDDIVQEKGAWQTFFWFGALLMLSKYLVQYKIIEVCGVYIQTFLSSLSPIMTFIMAFLIYYYCHYMFASATVKIGVLYATFMLVLLNFGFSPMLVAMALAYFSLLPACLTHYGLAPAPIFFSTGFFTISDWWKIGFVMSLVYLLIWSTIGGLWWKIIGWW